MPVRRPGYLSAAGLCEAGVWAEAAKRKLEREDAASQPGDLLPAEGLQRSRWRGTGCLVPVSGWPAAV